MITRTRIRSFSIFLLTAFVSSAVMAQDAGCSPRAKARLAEISGNVPTGYQELMQFDGWDRRAAFSMMSPEAQSAAWREHFESFALDNAGTLDAAQLEVLNQAGEVTSTRFLRTPKGDPSYSFLVQKQAEQLLKRAYELFSDDQIAAIFYHLGPADRAAQATKIPSCNCGHPFDCNGGYNTRGSCIEFGLECIPSSSGCGAWWFDPCTGRCVSP